MLLTRIKNCVSFKLIIFIVLLLNAFSNVYSAPRLNKDPFSEVQNTDKKNQNSLSRSEKLRKQPTYKAPLHHTKKIYRDSEKQMIYIPDKPLYFRVSLSSDENAKSYLIKKKSDKVKLDLSALIENNARVLLSLGKGVKDKFMIYKDIGSPEIVLNIAALQGSQSTIEKFGSCIVKLDAKDTDSGIDAIFISINGRIFKPYEKSITYIPKEIYSIRTYAVDLVGNISKPIELVFRIDSILAKQRAIKRRKRLLHKVRVERPQKMAFQVVEKLSLMAPQIVFEKSESQISNTKGNLLAPNSPLVLSRFNKIPAIKDIFIKFASNPKSVLKPFQGTPLDLALQERMEKEEEGTILEEKRPIEIEKIDVKKLLSKYSDQEPPFVMMEVLNDKFAGKEGLYVSKRSKVKLIAEDANLGVEKVWYKFDSKQKTVYHQPFKLKQKAGKHQLYFNAVDKGKNESQLSSMTLFLDNQLPKTNHSFTTPPFVRGKSIFINGTTHIKLSSMDKDSGVQKIWYHINNQDNSAFDENIQFPKEGIQRLEYFAVDQVNNQEKPRQVEIYVDKTPPTIFWQYSNSPRKDPENSKLVSKELFFPQGSVLFLAASDQKSGVKKISYQLNGQVTDSYKRPILFKHKGKYKLTVYAYDAVGNQSQKHTAFTIF